MDSLDYDPAILEETAARWTASNADGEYFEHCVDTLVLMGLISATEETYLNRLHDILFVHNLSDSQYGDSITAFAIDVDGITWGTNEVLCQSIAAIGLYSWEFHGEAWGGFDDLNQDYQIEFDLGKVGKEDVKGAVSGAVTGALVGMWQGGIGALPGAGVGAVTGAITGSVAETVGQLIDAWW